VRIALIARKSIIRCMTKAVGDILEYSKEGYWQGKAWKDLNLFQRLFSNNT
jgi:hypothetical protein